MRAIYALPLLLLVPHAAAQDGCLRESPCPWVVEVDAQGFEGGTTWNFTRGDWYTLSVFNWADAPRSVTLDMGAGGRIVVQVPALEEAESAPFNFTQAGRFTLSTDHGHTGQVVVLEGDVIDHSQGLGTGGTQASASGTNAGASRASPAAFALVAAGLVLAATARRGTA